MRARFTFWLVAGMVLGCCGMSPAADPTDPNLVGRWQLDDGSGTVAADTSGKCVDGELLGNPVWSTDGVDGGCLLFDGSDDYVFIDGHFKLATYTIAVWFRDDTAGQRDIVSAYAPGVQHGILLEVGTDGRLRFLHRFPLGTGGGNNIYSTATFGGDGQWHHAALTKSKTDIVLYIDGQNAGTMADTSVFDPTDSFGVALGCLDNERGLARMFLGAMDDVRIYNRALSVDEIQALTPRKLKAYKPNPADGTVGVSLPLLQWTKSETGSFYNVYVGTSPDLTDADLKGNRLPITMFYDAAGLQPGTTYYWRVDEIEADGTTIHPGSVWTFVTQDATAYYPTPANTASDIPTATTLTWMTPVGTVEHHLYFGDNLDAVTQAAADADKGALTEATFTPTDLESLKTYYWRVDEGIAGGTVKTGPVWSFTTTLPVDDFESYTDDLGSAIFDTWIDGLTNGLSGSVVGNAIAPFAEQKIVHGGLQSMPLDFNNIHAPFYSEAEREFAPAQDWTAGGAGALLLYVRGWSANRTTPVYVRLEDATQKAATVVHPDPAFAATTKWRQWRIPLTDFAGVNPAKVKKIAIGLGDKAATEPGGTGRLYIDDIQLMKSAPAQ
jgi:hypothetical protein